MAISVNRVRGWRARLPQSWVRRVCGRNDLMLQLVLAAAFLFFSSSASAQYPVRKNVLIINQVGLSHRVYVLVTEEIQSQIWPLPPRTSTRPEPKKPVNAPQPASRRRSPTKKLLPSTHPWSAPWCNCAQDDTAAYDPGSDPGPGCVRLGGAGAGILFVPIFN